MISRFLGVFKYSFFTLFFILLSGDAMAANCGENANPGIVAMCEMILMLQGRIGRALISFIIIMQAWQFSQGSIKWESVVTLFIGIALFYAPKTFAIFLLPDYIEGVYGEGYTPDMKITADEIISCACPDLR